MKQLLILVLCFGSTFFLTAQDLTSTKFPQSGKKKQLITCSTEDGKDLLEIYAVYIRDRINKKKVKFFKLNGKKYQIELKKKGVKKVFDHTGQIVAKISKGGKTISLVREQKEYFLEKSTNRKMIFRNNLGKEVIAITYANRKSLVQVYHPNTSANQLLTALCFNEFVDKKIREHTYGLDGLSALLFLAY